MQAYHNDSDLKAKIINQLQLHYDADKIIQVTYWENGKGCALGCIMQRDNSGNIHAEMENELGIIQPIPRLIDRIFEGLSNEIAKEFPLKIMKAIPVGKDLSNVWPQFVIWLLIDDKYGVIRHAKTYATKEAIKNVAILYERKLKGENIEIKEWREARSAAAAYAYADAAYAAAYAYAAYAAYAADAAAAAADAARKNHYKIMSDKLIELIG